MGSFAHSGSVKRFMLGQPTNLLLGALLTLSQNVHAAQPGSASPLPAKLRDITWGKLNFLHTTDTHGWLAGHLQE